jgi:hypothetical protein
MPVRSSSRERFLIVNVEPKEFGALFLDFDERREMVFRRTISGNDFREFLSGQAKSIFQRSWEGNYFFSTRRRLVVLADASLATTIPVPLDFKRDRDRVNESITMVEVEDWFARATAKIFAGCRAEASRRLGTNDVDTVLVNQRIVRIAIDGRVVADPVGRAAAAVSFVIELTFAARVLSDVLSPFFNAPGEFFFAEAPQARLSALVGAESLASAAMIRAGSDGTSSLFVFEAAEQGCPVVYREPFPWDATVPIRLIEEDLSVSRVSAEIIYRAYVRNDVSDGVKKYFDALIMPSFGRFLHAIDKAHLHGPVYSDTPYCLPFPLPYRRGSAILAPVPVETLLEHFGFSMREPTVLDPMIALRYLAPFFHLYFDTDRGVLNDLLRRKLHWLA